MTNEIDLSNVSPEGLSNTEKKSQNTAGNSPLLPDMRYHDIAKVFGGFASEARVTLIPIGFPGAGKSMLLSSMLRYAVRGNDPLFNVNFENKFPFNHGRIAADKMVEYFESGRLYETNRKGTLDLVGLNINPSNLNLPALQLACLDLAGEDIQNIKTSNKGDFTAKINAVFNGLQVDDSPTIFILITPFDPPLRVQPSKEAAHQYEDTLHFDFLNFLKQDQPKLFNASRFFIVVSQWDKNTNPKLDVETFIKKSRPALYKSIMNSDVIWGEYTIGKLLSTTDEDGLVFEELVKIDNEYPSRLWKKIYSVCTNKQLDQKSFWQKLFS